MKLVYFIFGLAIAFLVNGCGELNQPTPAQKNVNKKIKVYIDESADVLRSRAFLDEYVKILNEGFETKYNYKMSSCKLKKINDIRLRTYDNFNTIFDYNYVLNWKSSKLLSKNKMKLRMKAKRISDNSIEIKTNGTLCDIASKQIALKSVGFNKKALKKLLPYGYMDFNIDTLALKQHRLILNFYSKKMNIKNIFTKQLEKRGYTIVDNYKDADMAVFIENIMALPATFSAPLKNYFEYNKEKYFIEKVNEIHFLTTKSHKIHGEINAPASDLSRIADLRSVDSSKGSLEFEAGFYLVGHLLNALSFANKNLTTIGYKIIIENKHYNKNSQSLINKYRYRAAIYKNDIYSQSVIPFVDEYLHKKHEFIDDIVDYFDNDEIISIDSNLLKANYQDINKKYP